MQEPGTDTSTRSTTHQLSSETTETAAEDDGRSEAWSLADIASSGDGSCQVSEDFSDHLSEVDDIVTLTHGLKDLMTSLQARADSLVRETEAQRTDSTHVDRGRSLPLQRWLTSDDPVDDHAGSLSTEVLENHGDGRRALASVHGTRDGLQESSSSTTTHLRRLTRSGARETPSIDAPKDAGLCPNSEPLTDQQHFSHFGPGSAQSKCHGAGRGSTNGDEMTTTNRWTTSTPQKRKDRSSSDDQGRSGEDGESRDDSNRRRRLEPLSAERKSKLRLPCIYHVGEPAAFPAHTKKYEYIAQLLSVLSTARNVIITDVVTRRHLKSHDFFVCSRCFTRFEDIASLEAHDQTPCGKSCSRKSCKRHTPQHVERPSTCACITTPEQQWQELFRLQYPATASTHVFNDVEVQNVEASGTSRDVFDFDDFTMPGVGEPAFLNNPFADTVLHSIEDSNFGSSGRKQSEASIWNEMQILRQSIQLLEQRAAHPSGRESDLEMVLGLVWQALVLSGSTETQPDSPLCRLVQRFAGNVFGTATYTTTSSGQPSMDTSNEAPGLMKTIGCGDWTDLFNDAVPSENNPSISAHQTRY